MGDPWVVVAVTVVLIVLSAFFVAAEFALLAARRHRLDARSEHSRSARAAVRSFDELTVLLAGCQLGITACALGLGAVTKPAVNYALTPMFLSWGAPGWTADAVGFALALLVVTFLHLVIGEMAPKSYAIAHPERTAIALAMPMRAFMWFTRPVLRALNASANWCLRRVGVEPRDTIATGQNAADLRHLVEHSANVGALDASYSAQLTDALDLDQLTLADLTGTERELTAVGTADTVLTVRAVARDTGHLRVVVLHDGAAVGVVHVRDTMDQPDDQTAGEVMRDVLVLDGSTLAYEALAIMRTTRHHLVVVTTPNGPAVATLTDVVGRLLRAPAGAR
ncbi:CBS domain containing-hemolysin-like protein [Micromonospora sp. M71_S20]|uniref:hemolysin family protein n=1 Tax=Micromonospora sp. M71_S20 TaxID=592872 RepID=UPI000EAC1CDC|nr:hemolysin family protein [Micromonospora sp. M71_S20]RLK24846.1 CBS domain containing-hemolysin-like protein [Micromonospora sp. M71_S20]